MNIPNDIQNLIALTPIATNDNMFIYKSQDKTAREFNFTKNRYSSKGQRTRIMKDDF